MGLWLKSQKLNNDDMRYMLYPRRFMSKDEVDSYTSGDRVTCLICDRSFKNLATHIVAGHGCDPKQYRDILNIPRSHPLGSKDYIDRITENSRHLFHNEMTEDQRNFLMMGTHNKSGYSGGVFSSIAKEGQIGKLAENGKRNKGKKHGRTMGQCFSCESEIEISTQRINRVTKCKPCLKKEGAERIKKYAQSNKEKIRERKQKWRLEKLSKKADVMGK